MRVNHRDMCAAKHKRATTERISSSSIPMTHVPLCNCIAFYTEFYFAHVFELIFQILNCTFELIILNHTQTRTDARIHSTT